MSGMFDCLAKGMIAIIVSALMVGFLSGIVFTRLSGILDDDNGYRTMAIEGGCAEYNKTTGELQWIKRGSR